MPGAPDCTHRPPSYKQLFDAPPRSEMTQELDPRRAGNGKVMPSRKRRKNVAGGRWPGAVHARGRAFFPPRLEGLQGVSHLVHEPGHGLHHLGERTPMPYAIFTTATSPSTTPTTTSPRWATEGGSLMAVQPTARLPGCEMAVRASPARGARWWRMLTPGQPLCCQCWRWQMRCQVASGTALPGCGHFRWPGTWPGRRGASAPRRCCRGADRPPGRWRQSRFGRPAKRPVERQADFFRPRPRQPAGVVHVLAAAPQTRRRPRVSTVSVGAHVIPCWALPPAKVSPPRRARKAVVDGLLNLSRSRNTAPARFGGAAPAARLARRAQNSTRLGKSVRSSVTPCRPGRLLALCAGCDVEFDGHIAQNSPPSSPSTGLIWPLPVGFSPFLVSVDQPARPGLALAELLPWWWYTRRHQADW